MGRNIHKIIATVAALSPTAALADMSGFYAGGSLIASTNDTIDIEDRAFELSNHTAFGGFAGYQMQNGQYVYGAELALTVPSDRNLGDMVDFGVTYTDIKARVGYVSGEVTTYGVVGYSSVSFGYDEDGTDDDVNFSTRGLNYGVGLDYAISNKLVIGAEYLARSVSGVAEDVRDMPKFDLNANTLSLRAAYKF